MNGQPNRPVTSEYPAKPAWILIGEGPTRTETQINRPLCSAGVQQTVDKALAKVGAKRDDLVLTTAVLCNSPMGKATEQDKERAVAACKPRLQRELAQWPGLPILTLGATAARAVIPKATLDAIDPPNVPKLKKRNQKERQKAEAKAFAKDAKRRAREIGKLATKRLKDKIKYRRTQIYDEMMEPLASEPYRKRKKPPAALVTEQLERETPTMKVKADAEAITEYEAGAAIRDLRDAFEAANPKPKPPPKPKPIKITDIISTCFEVDVDGTGIIRPVIPAIHPLVLIKGGGATIGGTHTPDLAFINLIYDISKVQSLAQGKDIRLKLNIQTETTDPERTWQLLRDIVYEAIEEGEVALDLETYVDDPERHHALMAYMARIRTIGLATSKRTISIMWELIPPWAFSYVQLLLAHPRVTKTLHNGLYDRTVLMANGYALGGPWEDTLLAHHAAFPGNAHRLQTVTAQFFATPPWKSEFRNAEETAEGLTQYNAIDTGATRALRPALTVMVKRTKTEKIYALDKKMSEIASKMHLAGMPVCRETNSELLTTFSKNVAESRQAVDEIAADPKLRTQIWHHLALQQAQTIRKNDPTSYVKADGEVVKDFEARFYTRLNEIEYDTKWKWKIGSGKHIAALLQASSIPLHQVTATGQISTKKDILESLAHVPVVRDILTFRENDKLLSTFVWRLFDRYKDGELIQHGYADDNDRIHPIWSVHKITGRWASSEPVCSNVPKDKFKKLADGTKVVVRPNLRRQIRAPKGRMFVGFDFAQLEARVIALISGDPFLCAVFAAGLDVHAECAKVVFPTFGTMPKDEQKQARNLTKPLEFGAFYGGAVETLWKNLVKEGVNIKLVDVARAVALLMNKMTGVVRWQRECVATALQPPHEIKDFLLARRRTFPLGQVEATEAMNFGVQAAGAAIMNTGMAIADDGLKAYKEAFVVHQIHDSALFECWADDADRLAEDVNRWFPQSYERDGRTIPFPIETLIAESWAGI